MDTTNIYDDDCSFNCFGCDDCPYQADCWDYLSSEEEDV